MTNIIEQFRPAYGTYMVYDFCNGYYLYSIYDHDEPVTLGVSFYILVHNPNYIAPVTKKPDEPARSLAYMLANAPDELYNGDDPSDFTGVYVSSADETLEEIDRAGTLYEIITRHPNIFDAEAVDYLTCGAGLEYAKIHGL